MVREDSSWLAGWCVAGGPANGIGSWIPLWEGWGRLERVHHIIWRVCEKSESDYGLGFKKLPHDSRTTIWLLSPPCQSAWKPLLFGSAGHLCINLVPSVLGRSQNYCTSFVWRRLFNFASLSSSRFLCLKSPTIILGSSLPKNGALRKGADFTLSEACPWPAQSPVFID